MIWVRLKIIECQKFAFVTKEQIENSFSLLGFFCVTKCTVHRQDPDCVPAAGGEQPDPAVLLLPAGQEAGGPPQPEEASLLTLSLRQGTVKAVLLIRILFAESDQIVRILIWPKKVIKEKKV